MKCKMCSQVATEKIPFGQDADGSQMFMYLCPDCLEEGVFGLSRKSERDMDGSFEIVELRERVIQLYARVLKLEEENAELMQEINRFYRVAHQGVEG